MADDEAPIPVGRYEWERIVRRCVLPLSVKSVAAHMAQYANSDGTSIFPGEARLAAVSGMTDRSVRDALAVLRDVRLVVRVRKGSSLGRQALADEYRLTRPPDLELRVHMLDPDESPESASCDQTCGHPRSPERLSGDKPRRRKEHRNVLPRTPETDDRNTGSTFRPPPKDQPLPPSYQREDHLEDVTTEGAGPDDDTPDSADGCATCDRRGLFPLCCEVHGLPLCPACLRSIHAQALVAQEAS